MPRLPAPTYAQYLHEHFSSMDWLLMGKHDPASTTFCAALFGHTSLIDESVFPLSPVSLGRCVEVFEMVLETHATDPDFRHRLDPVAALGGPWTHLVAHWEAVIGCFELEKQGHHGGLTSRALATVFSGHAPQVVEPVEVLVETAHLSSRSMAA